MVGSWIVGFMTAGKNHAHRHPSHWQVEQIGVPGNGGPNCHPD